MRRYQFPILSGFLIGTSYIPFPPWALFFCLSPLFYFWWKRAERPRDAFFAGWITQFILNLIGFHWIAYTAVEFGHFPWPFGVVVLLGFAAIAHLYYPIAGWAAFHLVRKFGLAGGWALMTYVLTFLFCDRIFGKIFPWHLGYPWLWAGWTGAQVADVIGFEGLSYLTAMVSALLTWAAVETWLDTGRPTRGPTRGPTNKLIRPTTKAWCLLGLAALGVLLPNLIGRGRAEPWRQTDSELRVLAVQGNIGNFEKYLQELSTSFALPIVGKYLDLARAGAHQYPDADVMVWPETAFPGSLDSPYLHLALQSDIRAFIRKFKLPLISGGYSYVNQAGQSETYNGLFFLNASGIPTAPPYRKSILLVFGETFPFSDTIPYMQKLFPEQGSFQRGPGPIVWSLDLEHGKNVRVGPQICYEGLYPWFSASLAQTGAEVFANVTNDSWFWHPFEPNQHLYMTLARALEFRRPLFRVTNTGISTAMLASGEILQKSPSDKEWWGLFKIPYRAHPEHTSYERFGYLWPWILLSALALVLALGNRLGLRSARGIPTPL